GRIMRVAPPDQRTGIGKFFETPSRREVYDYSYDGVMRSFEASLERLGVDRIDILFVHDVDIFTHGSKEASDARIAEFMSSGYTLLEQEALQSFLPLCQKRGIGIVLGGPYNSGVLATGPKPGAFYNYSEAPKEILDRVARIEAVCKHHNVRLIEAALQFPLQHPSVMSVIPGGQRPSEVESNRALLDTKIPAALWADLKQEGLMRADAPTA
ncbi:MAG: aldo/keto reductase, partial [Mesorhizobium sp.]